MMRKVIFMILLFMCKMGIAQTSSLNLAVPSASPNFQSDRIRAGEIECDAVS